MKLLAAARTWLQSLPVLTVDTAIAVTIFVLCTLSLLLVDPMTTMVQQPTDAFAFVLVAAMTLPVALRRRYPVPVFLVVCVAMSAYEILAYGGINVDFFGPIVALYSVIAYGPRRFAPWAPVLAFLAITVSAPFVMAPDTTVGSFLTQAVNVAAIIGLVWFLSDTVRTRREQATELAAKNLELEAARDELAHQAVADERVRIARELHDVVAHSMSVIAVQSGMGRMVIATQPEEAARALASIEETSRSSLNEMRRILSVLRSSDETEGSLEPAPTLLDLDQLVAQTRAVGVEVDLEVTGERGAVPAGVDLSAYRIVQEALTNVIKHAGPARATVTIHYAPTVVSIEVVDDGRGAAALASVGAREASVRDIRSAAMVGRSGFAASIDGGGNGLVGMRERASVYGGEVEAGPVPGGGFRVRARLPFDGGRP
jgi:signal transduction histidine kinase